MVPNGMMVTHPVDRISYRFIGFIDAALLMSFFVIRAERLQQKFFFHRKPMGEEYQCLPMEEVQLMS